MKKTGTWFSAVFFCGLLFGLGGCGPVNHRPAEPAGSGANAPGGANQLDSGAVGGGSVHSSQKGLFLVRAKLKAEGAPTVVAAPTAKIGDNIFLFRFAQAETWTPLSKETQVTLQYQRLDSRLPKKYDAPVQRQDDGSFAATVTFKKAGQWEMSIHLTDGTLQDDYVFQTVLE